MKKNSNSVPEQNLSATHSHHHEGFSDDTSQNRLVAALSITSFIFLAEVIGALFTGSLALLVDAAHILTDLSGLVMAVVAARLSQRPPDGRRTWGFARAEILSAAAQSGALAVVGVFVLVEAVRRLFSQNDIESSQLLIFGFVGLAGNLAAMIILRKSRNSNLNMKAAFLEVSSDAFGSLAVILAALAIKYLDWGFSDSVAAIVISLLIVPRAVQLLRQTISILMESTPKELNLDGVRDHILKIEHVLEVHDLHASFISSGLPVLTAHVVVEDDCFKSGHSFDILSELQDCVATHFAVNIEHSTFQLESLRHKDRFQKEHS